LDSRRMGLPWKKSRLVSVESGRGFKSYF